MSLPQIIAGELDPDKAAAASLTMLARQMSRVEVVNTAAESDLAFGPGGFVVPGGIMGDTGLLHLNLRGTYLNNSPAARTLTLRVRFGAALLYEDATPSTAASAVRRAFYLDLLLQNFTAASQGLAGLLLVGAADAPATGTGGLGAMAGLVAPFFGVLGAVDTALDQALRVTVAHSNAHASLDVRSEFAKLELIL